MTLAQRILLADAARIGRCPSCSRLVAADPSMRVVATCLCGAVLHPRRAVGGVEFSLTSKESN